MGVYTEYFQKSKVFLYPLLDIKKGATYVPRQTYIAWEDMYSIEDRKFICVYQTPMTERFNRFIHLSIINHGLFEDYVKLDENKHLFLYNFDSLKFDYDNFIKGKYSKIGLDSKIKILDFFGDDEKVTDYIHPFLSPQDHHEEYAEYLNVDIKSLQEVHEVCTPPDIEKETLVDNNYLLARLLEDSSISLKK